MDLFTGPSTRDKWVVVARKPSGVAASRPDEIGEEEWQWEGSPPDKENFEFEYGDILEPGIRYVCVPTADDGLDFDSIEWQIKSERTLDPEEKATRAVQRELEEFKEQMIGAGGGDVDLTSVDSQDALEARLKGVISQQGLAVAEDVDDVVKILDAVKEDRTPTGSPMVDMLTDADNNLEINSPTDFAMLMMMPELKEMAHEGKGVLTNIQELTGGAGSAGRLAGELMSQGDGTASDDTVEVSRDELEALRARAETGGEPAAEATADVEDTPADEATEDDSFDMSEYVDEDADESEAEPEPEGDSDEEPAETTNATEETVAEVDMEAGEVTSDHADDDSPGDEAADATEVRT